MQFIMFLLGLVLAMLGFFLSPLIGVLAGGFAGWVVGFFWSNTFLGILAQVGIHGFALWKIGAFLGFIGGFFRSAISTSTSSTSS